MAKKKHSAGSISNRRARHDYALGDSLIVGLELTGAETKALRRGHGQLQGSYVTLNDGQLWLINALISGDTGAPISETDQTRARRLLAKRKEIDSLMAQRQQGMTIVPLEILTKGRYIKLRISAARGKKRYDKRETLKQRDQQRQINRLNTP
jgi:SsrA-binding protein